MNGIRRCKVLVPLSGAKLFGVHAAVALALHIDPIDPPTPPRDTATASAVSVTVFGCTRSSPTSPFLDIAVNTTAPSPGVTHATPFSSFACVLRCELLAELEGKAVLYFHMLLHG